MTHYSRFSSTIRVLVCLALVLSVLSPGTAEGEPHSFSVASLTAAEDKEPIPSGTALDSEGRFTANARSQNVGRKIRASPQWRWAKPCLAVSILLSMERQRL